RHCQSAATSPRMPTHERDASGAASGQSASGVRWDLRELYAGPTDPALDRDLAAARAEATAFVSGWRGRIARLGAAELRRALEEYEHVQTLGQRPGFYAALLTASDTQDPVALAL